MPSSHEDGVQDRRVTLQSCTSGTFNLDGKGFPDLDWYGSRSGCFVKLAMAVSFQVGFGTKTKQMPGTSEPVSFTQASNSGTCASS